jgi:membrane associated rhomboid family serine protease
MKQILKSVFSYKVIEPIGVIVLAFITFNLIAEALTAANTFFNILGAAGGIITALILLAYLKDKFWPVAEVEEVKTPEPEVEKPKRKKPTKK